MSPIFFLKKNNKMFALVFTVFIVLNCAAQAPIRKPFMWISQEEGKDQIKHFTSLKLKLMSKKAGLPTGQLLNNKVLLNNFWGMIAYFDTRYKDTFQYLHVFLCINDSKKFTFVFAPAASEGESGGLGYYYLPKKFDAKNIDEFKVSSSVKKSWCDKFVKSMALTTIGNLHVDNQYPNDDDSAKKPSDTRSVTYCAADIQELLKVKKYYVTKGYPISDSLNGYLGSYSLNGMLHGKYKGHFVNRIMVQFEFLNKNGSEFYLDTIPKFMALEPAENSNCFRAVDNGQLCPTNCPKQKDGSLF